MTLVDGFRLWFLALYGLGVGSFIIMILFFRTQKDALEKQEGPLPTPFILIPLGVPIIFLLARLGEIPGEWRSLRLIGVVLSLYFLVMLPWMMRSLGRFALPGAGIFQDHKLVTSGPYHFIRHPLYSAAIILWLSAGLGTLNWLMLVLWPVFVAIIVFVPVRNEEQLLYEKFGAAYEQYAQQTDRLIPRVY